MEHQTFLGGNMSEEAKKKLRKISRCVQTMLELDGVDTTSKRVEEVIKGQSLEDPFKLKELVLEVLQSQGADKTVTSPTATTRREALQTFITAHWDEVKDNDPVKSALLNAYCMGRYKKDKRDEMVAQLITLCEGGTVVAVIPAPATTSPTETTEKVVDNDQELRSLPSGHTDYKF